MSPTKVAQVLIKAKADYLNEGFWIVGGPAAAYSSASGHRELSEKIKEKL